METVLACLEVNMQQRATNEVTMHDNLRMRWSPSGFRKKIPCKVPPVNSSTLSSSHLQRQTSIDGWFSNGTVLVGEAVQESLVSLGLGWEGIEMIRTNKDAMENSEKTRHFIGSYALQALYWRVNWILNYSFPYTLLAIWSARNPRNAPHMAWPVHFNRWIFVKLAPKLLMYSEMSLLAKS